MIHLHESLFNLERPCPGLLFRPGPCANCEDRRVAEFLVRASFPNVIADTTFIRMGRLHFLRPTLDARLIISNLRFYSNDDETLVEPVLAQYVDDAGCWWCNKMADPDDPTAIHITRCSDVKIAVPTEEEMELISHDTVQGPPRPDSFPFKP